MMQAEVSCTVAITGEGNENAQKDERDLKKAIPNTSFYHYQIGNSGSDAMSNFEKFESLISIMNRATFGQEYLIP